VINAPLLAFAQGVHQAFNYQIINVYAQSTKHSTQEYASTAVLLYAITAVPLTCAHHVRMVMSLQGAIANVLWVKLSVSYRGHVSVVQLLVVRDVILKMCVV